jgi:hypothetical protein
MLAALNSARYRQLLDRLDQAVRQPRVVTADLSLSKIAARQFKKLRKKARAAGAKGVDLTALKDRAACRTKEQVARMRSGTPSVGRPALAA